MRITESQLRQIIREEITGPRAQVAGLADELQDAIDGLIADAENTRGRLAARDWRAWAEDELVRWFNGITGQGALSMDEVLEEISAGAIDPATLRDYVESEFPAWVEDTRDALEL